MKQYFICALLLSLMLAQSCTASERLDLENHPLKAFFNGYGKHWLKYLGIQKIRLECSWVTKKKLPKSDPRYPYEREACDTAVAESIKLIKDELGLTVTEAQINHVDMFEQYRLIMNLNMEVVSYHSALGRDYKEYYRKTDELWLAAGGKFKDQ